MEVEPNFIPKRSFLYYFKQIIVIKLYKNTYNLGRKLRETSDK